jgi:hypothetical protein
VLPPLVGVAVNVTLAPVHILVVDALIATLAVTAGVTVMVMLLDETVAGEGQAALDVTSSVITSALASVVVVYDDEVAPFITLPFFLHT